MFGATLVAFFLAEMGDKTQIATVALAAQYQALVAVVAGTTLGMMIANVPAVLLGDRIATRMPVERRTRIAVVILRAGHRQPGRPGQRWGSRTPAVRGYGRRRARAAMLERFCDPA